jgi:hypothetical protein
VTIAVPIKRELGSILSYFVVSVDSVSIVIPIEPGNP